MPFGKMAEHNQQCALPLTGEINENTLRQAVTNQSTNPAFRRTTRAATRALTAVIDQTPFPSMHASSPDNLSTSSVGSTSIGGFLPAQKPLLSIQIQQSTGSDSSSPLTSPPPSPEGPTTTSGAQASKIKTGKPKNLSDITIEDANQRSQPLPGPELLRLVDEAKSRGEIPKLYDSMVVRFVDGAWMAPQKCKSCQDYNKTCNRKSPCNKCKNISDCQTDGLMTIVSARGFQLATIQTDLDNSTAAGAIITHGTHGQNINGSWYNNTTVLLKGVAATTAPRKKRCVSRHIDNNKVDTDSDSMDVDELENNPHAKSRLASKRKAEDEDEYVLPDLPVANTKGRSTRKGVRKNSAARATYYANIQNDKPEPFGQPKVHANTRQAACEALPWFKAYQSAAYTHKGVVYGLLCDKEVGPRDKFDDSIIVTRVGGGREPDANGNMVQMKDQDDTIPFAFRRNMTEHLPVGIIAGKGNKICPVKLKSYYSVLDWFHVTDVWCEKNGEFRSWVIRLEKINLMEQSWWSPKDSQYHPPDFQAAKLESPECEACHTRSKHIYNQGWTCLNEGCAEHFKFSNEFDEEMLDYNEAFLKERTEYTGTDPGPLAPPLLTDQYFKDMDEVGIEIFGVEKEFKGAMVCTNCGCCSRRLEWIRWSCENPECDFVHRVRQKTVSVDAASVQSQNGQMKLFAKGGIRTQKWTYGWWDIYKYTFIGEKGETVGFTFHIKSHCIINEQPDGPDDLFYQMQEVDLGMSRSPARLKGFPGEMTTSHFATNWGAPYKYGVAQASRGFDEAPVVILKALKRLTWAGQLATASATEISEEYHDPNELLTIGYFEDSTIGYHDDGEKELGPTVASLSLGASATMCWRPKAKSSLGNSGNQRGTKPDVLRIQLDHGDIMVMHGAKIQQLYEHAVFPHGKLRFALTSRYMVPGQIPKKIDRDLAALKGALPAGHEQYDYNGDVNAKARPNNVDHMAEVTGMIEAIGFKHRNGRLTKEQGKDAVDQLKIQLGLN